MKQEDKHFQTLLKHEHFFDTYMAVQTISGLYPDARKEIVDAYRVEFPHYSYVENCGVCIAGMIVEVYTWFKKEKEIILKTKRKKK